MKPTTTMSRIAKTAEMRAMNIAYFEVKDVSAEVVWGSVAVLVVLVVFAVFVVLVVLVVPVLLVVFVVLTATVTFGSVLNTQLIPLN